MVNKRGPYQAMTQLTYAHAAQALRSGNAVQAHVILTDMASRAALSAQDQWLMAQVCRRLDDAPGEKAALAAVLRERPRDLAALLAMGDWATRAQDDRAAASWFSAALAQAAATPPPPSLHPLLVKAQAFCRTAQDRFTAHLDNALSDFTIDTRHMPMLSHALDLLRGTSQIHLQQPSMFYYPGLPQRAFYERSEFAWVGAIEAQAPVLRDELLTVMARNDGFAPYVERTADRPAPANPLLDDLSWGARYLWRDGVPTPLAEHCPATMAALSLAPVPIISHRSPMALYSRLRPDTHIKPHHGLLNTRLICHLPLVTPDDCALRVGHETREWRFGEMLIFDDSIEHEAWNRGLADRTILLFEIWRPEIPVEERAILTHLFAAIDAIDPARGHEGGA